MKKYIFTVLLLFSVMATSADDRSDALLSKMAATISGWDSYRVEFSLTMDEGLKPVTGEYTVSGRSYLMKAGESELFGDGTVKYQVDHINREVTIDSVDPADAGILADPTRVFDFSDTQFNHAWTGRKSFHGRTVETVTLTPKVNGGLLRSVTLMVDPATSLPAGVSYLLEGVSRPVEIQVTHIAPLSQPSGLKFDPDRYKGYEIIDFR